MVKSDRLRLIEQAKKYIEDELHAEIYTEKTYRMYDYGVQTKYGLLNISVDKDYEGSELFTIFARFDEGKDIHPDCPGSRISDKYNLHILLKGMTVESVMCQVREHFSF